MNYLPNINFRSFWPFKGSDEKISVKPVRRPKSTNRRYKSPSGSVGISINPWEAKLVSLQSILIWETPKTSVLYLILINVIYWLIALSNVRLVSTISLFSLAYFLHNQWVYTIWPEISVPQAEPKDNEDWTPVNPSVLSAPELCYYLEKSWNYFRKKCTKLLLLRRREPGKFCLLVFLFFLFGFFVGCLIPGVWLLYIIVMTIFCLPGIVINFVPKSFIIFIKSFISFVVDSTAEQKNDPEKELMEFFPEETDDAQALLGIPLSPNDPPVSTVKRGRKVKKGTRKRKAETSNNDSLSFTVGLEEFPSIVPDEVSESELELPEIERTPTPEVARREDNNQDIHFVNTHFGDSSEDEEFEVGLTFNVGRQVSEGAIMIRTQIAQPVIQSTALTQVTQIFSTVMSDLVTSVMGPSNTGSDHQDSIIKEENINNIGRQSSTDEFELISDDDIQ